MEKTKAQELGIITISYSEDTSLIPSDKVLSHCEGSDSLDSLIFDWIGENRSVMLVNADCDPGEEDGFILYLRENEKDLAEIVISMKWLRSAFPSVPPATAVEHYTDEFEKEWCQILSDDILKREDNLKIIVSYLFAEYSQIIIDGEADFLLEECSEKELEPIKGKQLICVMPHYSDPKTGHGFGAHYWSFQ